MRHLNFNFFEVKNFFFGILLSTCFGVGCATFQSAQLHQPNLGEGPDSCHGPHVEWVCEGKGDLKICGCVIKPSYQKKVPYHPMGPLTPPSPIPPIGGQD